MSDVQRIVELYNLYGSKRRVAKELNISRNTGRLTAIFRLLK